MKFFKYINTIPESPAEGSFEAGDEIKVRKGSGTESEPYYWNLYKVAANGSIDFVRGITDEQNSRLERLSTDQIAKVESITTGDITKLKEDYTKAEIDTKITDLGNLSTSSKVSLGNSTVLPVPPQSGGVTIPNAWVELAQNVTYTQSGGSPITGIDGHRSIAEWNGTTWSLVDMGELPQTDTSTLLSKNDDGNKLLSSGLFYPKVIEGFYVNATSANGSIGAIISNPSFIMEIYEIEEGSVSAVKLTGSFHYQTVFYIAQFSGDINNVANFIQGQRRGSNLTTNIDEYYSITPNTRFIVTCRSIGSVVTNLAITEVKQRSVTLNQGQEFPFVGYPAISDYYLKRIKNGILNAQIKAHDNEKNYYQIAKISRINKPGNTVTPNSIAILKRKIDDDSVIQMYDYRSDQAMTADNARNIAKLSLNGQQTVVLKDKTFEISLTIDCDSFNESSTVELAYPEDNTERVNNFAGFKFEESCYIATEQKEFIEFPTMTRVDGKWYDSTGTEQESAALYYKFADITPNTFSRVRVVGTVNFSQPLWFGQFNSEQRESDSFINGQKLPVTGVTQIDQWVNINPASASVIIGSSGTSPNNYDINIVDFELVEKLPEELDTNLPITKYGSSNVGFIDNRIEKTDYIHVIAYGQSLMHRPTPNVGVTFDNILGNFMVNDRPQYAGGNITGISPLSSYPSEGEIPLVTAVHQFSQLYRKFVDNEALFLASSCALSNRSIEVLSKESTNEAYFEFSSLNTYQVRFERLVDRTKAYMDSIGKTISCPVITYVQGESNYVGTGMGLTTGSNQTRDKNEWKALFLQLKNNMQDKIVAVYGQSYRPVFFIYQTGRRWVNRKDLSITIAQQELAAEHDDIILMNPDYAMSGFGSTSDHFTSNGARWYGELIGKSLYYHFVKNEESPVCSVKNVLVSQDRRKVVLDCRVPVEPLIIDTWSAKEVDKYGFSIFNNSNSMGINSVRVINGNQVEISLSAAVQNGELEVCYANNSTEGRGNLRDSDAYRGMFLYVDYTSEETTPEEWVSKDEQGQPIYGSRYPLYNWLSNFYRKITIQS